MTDNTTDEKIYTRTFQPDSGESLALVAKHIPAASRVLDIGCGAGDLGHYLRAEKDCTVIGIDYSAASLAVAADKLDKALQVDLNTQNVHEHVAVDDKFDVIVMADILEHLMNPQAVLLSAQQLLKADGKVLISIPNAGYVGALLSLYDDEWNYREEGILDRTHVRFYTKKSIMALLADNGFDGYLCDRVRRDLLDSEFRQRIDSQVDSVRDWLLAKPEGSTYQFIIEARPKTQQYRFPAVAKPLPMSLQHIVKIYWQADVSEAFNETNYAIKRGEMGKQNCLRFKVGLGQIHKIRLNFADRRGVYCLDQIRIFDGEQLLWSAQQNNYTIKLSDAGAHYKRLPMVIMAHHAEAFLLLTLEKTIDGDDILIEVVINAPVSEYNNAFIDSVSFSDYQQLQQKYTKLIAARQAITEQHQMAQTVITEREQQLVQIRSEYEKMANKKDKEINKLLLQQQQLLDSSSWQLTAPLRVISRFFKKS
ncbi:MAG: hypothetical protein CSA44_01420 [Gammaproteobacteria bacterium]|nr:MAG: hypothetical protein CSA44_01420 [Gammaproteobacteria bacterium]